MTKERTRSSSGYLGLFVFALALRLAYDFQQAGSNPLFDYPTVDADAYSSWAQEILSGHWAWPDLRNYLPVYPAFVAACRLALGGSAWSVKVIQALLSSCAAVLLAISAGRAFGRRVGLISGFLLAANWLFVLYDAELYSETLCDAALVIFMYFVARRALRPRDLIGASLACTVAVACRPNLGPLFAVLVIWAARGKSWHIGVTRAAVVLVAPVLLFGAIILHNHKTSGEWVLRAEQAWNIYAALNPDFGGLHPTAGQAFNRYMNAPMTAGMLANHQQEEYWLRESIKLLRSEPGKVAWNYVATRLAVFVSNHEWSQEFDVQRYRSYASILELPWPGLGFTWTFAASGFAVALAARMRRRRGPRRYGHALRVLWGASLLLTAAFTFAFKVAGRYRMPTVVLLIPWAASGIAALIWPRARWHRWVALAGAVPAALSSFPDWQHLEQRQTAHHEMYIANKYEGEGHFVEAEAAYRAESSRQPADATPDFQLARMLSRVQRSADALAAVKEALRRDPGFWEAWNLEGAIELDLKQPALAEPCFDRSLQLYPPQFEGWVLKSQAAFALGQWADWRAAAKAAIEHGAGGWFFEEDALRLEQTGDLRAAIEELERAASDEKLPEAPRAQALILACDVMAMDLHDAARAQTCWGRIVSAFGDDPVAGAAALFLVGRLSEAEYKQRAESLGAPASLDSFLLHTAIAAELQGRADDARARFSAFLARQPDPQSSAIPVRWARQAASPR